MPGFVEEKKGEEKNEEKNEEVKEVKIDMQKSDKESHLKIPEQSKIYNFLVSFLLIVIFFSITITIIYRFNFTILSFLSVTLYLIGMLSHLFLQLILAILNRPKMRNFINKNRKGNISIQITGWNEKPRYYRYCLSSIKQQTDPRISKILFLTDGHDDKMYSIYKEFFPNGSYIKLEKHYLDMTPAEKLETLQNISERIVMIQSPKRGKRETMYLGMEIAEHYSIDYTMLVDSDTIVLPNSTTRLAEVLDNSNSSAVTGDVRIFNIQTGLSFVTNLKYWFAFNLERSAQSYYDVVSCVSGPLGMYKTQILNVIKKDWVDQKFCGIKCTFGDDRNLTNLVLKKGGKITYTQEAVCYTETPTNFNRFIAQQTRWNKSAVREFLIGLGYTKNHSKYLVYDNSYVFLYNYILIIIAILIFLSNDIKSIVYLFVAVLTIGTFRGLYGCVIERSISFLYFSLYGILHLSVMLPSKIWATLTFYKNDWGTGNRSMKCNFNILDNIPVILWNASVIYFITNSVINSVINSIEFSTHSLDDILYPTAFIFLYLIVLLLGFPIIRYFEKKNISEKLKFVEFQHESYC